MWTLPISQGKPMLTIWIDEHEYTGIADTGAEQTCFPIYLSSKWSTVPGPTVQGATGAEIALQSVHQIPWKDKEGNSGFICPLFLRDLPTILWGRDILGQAKTYLTTQQPPQS